MISVLPVKVSKMTAVNLSFAAAGFMGIYHLGAAEAFLRHGQKLMGSRWACAGASAGSLVAAVMITAPDKLEVHCSSPHSAHRLKKRFVEEWSGLTKREPSGVPEPIWSRNLKNSLESEGFKATVVDMSFTVSSIIFPSIILTVFHFVAVKLKSLQAEEPLSDIQHERFDVSAERMSVLSRFHTHFAQKCIK